MEFDPPKFIYPQDPDKKEYELLSMQEYKDRMGVPDLPTPTLNYKLRKNQLDYVTMGTFRYIIYDEKARNMKVLKRRPPRP